MSAKVSSVAFEGELNSIVREYLEFGDYLSTLARFEDECTERGKPISVITNDVKSNEKLARIQREMMSHLEAGNRRAFQQLWEENLPRTIRDEDPTAQKLQFYINIYFATYPMRTGGEKYECDEAMQRFKSYIESTGAALSQTTEFLPFYALPFVPNPKAHPTYRDIFTDIWVDDLKTRTEKFLALAFQSSPQPKLFQLYSISGGGEDLHARLRDLQQQVVDGERRAMTHMRRNNKVQADYHNLIGITAELVDALENTVHGKPVRPEYLQQICTRLFSSQTKFSAQSVDLSRPGTAASVLRASVQTKKSVASVVPGQLMPLDYDKIKTELAGEDTRRIGLLLQALRWRLTKSSLDQRDAVVSSYITNDLLGSSQDGPHRETVLGLLCAEDEICRQYTARLFNAMASVNSGRTYLSQNPLLLTSLIKSLKSEQKDSIGLENVLGCLQKLSLKRSLQTAMIREDIISWLVQVLEDHDALSDYTLEYSIALLMNLCLRSQGKRQCVPIAGKTLKMLTDLLGHDNQEILPYVNGTLYSILAIPSIREEAKSMATTIVPTSLRDEGSAETETERKTVTKDTVARETEPKTVTMDTVTIGSESVPVTMDTEAVTETEETVTMATGQVTMNAVDVETEVAMATAAGRSESYLLPTMAVRIHGPEGSLTTYAFADSGSRASLLDEKIAVRLGIEGPLVTRKLTTVRDAKDQVFMEVRFSVSNVSSGHVVQLDKDVYVMKGIDLGRQLGRGIPKMDVSRYEHLAGLKLPEVEVEGVHVLLGLPVLEAHEAVNYFRGGVDEPFVIETQLGFAFAGPIPGSEVDRPLQFRHFDLAEPSSQQAGAAVDEVRLYQFGVTGDVELATAMDRFCQIEEVGTEYPTTMRYTKSEQAAIRLFQQTVEQKPDRHYQSGLLWKDPNCFLPFNRSTAERRFISLERKFSKDAKYAEMYTAAMNESIERGWASPIPMDEVGVLGPRTFYLSHFGVQNDNKPNKVRPVYDLREKTDGVSLNDCLLTGPSITSTLVGVLLRCRVAKVCVAADIKSMFYQCGVAEPDRDSLRFIWYGSDGQARDFRMNVHVFGAADSPFVANSCLRKVAEDHGSKYDPDIAEIVRENFYVDDLVYSQPTIEDAIRTSLQVKALLEEGGFELVKFASNEREVLRSLNQSDLARPEVDLEMDDLPGERTLGLKWELESDSFGFKICSSGDKPDTMRGMASVIARVFDPLGFGSPVILAGRLIMQECWRRKLSWDDELPTDLLNRWRTWRLQLPSLDGLKVPRPYFPLLDTCMDPELGVQLHIFSDASSEATGCVAYLRIEFPDGQTHVGFVMSKARVSPKRPKLTIPRAELKAAVEAVRLEQLIATELGLDIASIYIFFWTDSEIVLKYIGNDDTQFHVFVANRQSEIRLTTNYEQWNFCPGIENPADYPSRGVAPGDYSSDHRFLVGPEFLEKPRSEWPAQNVDTALDSTDPEVRVMSMNFMETTEGDPTHLIKMLDRCSKFSKAKRVLVWIHRLAGAMRRRSKLETSIFTVDELERAETMLVKAVQCTEYADEIAEAASQSCSEVLLYTEPKPETRRRRRSTVRKQTDECTTRLCNKSTHHSSEPQELPAVRSDSRRISTEVDPRRTGPCTVRLP